MTKDAEHNSQPTPSTFFWLGIYHTDTWRFDDGTKVSARHWVSHQSGGPRSAMAFGTFEESVNLWSNLLYDMNLLYAIILPITLFYVKSY